MANLQSKYKLLGGTALMLSLFVLWSFNQRENRHETKRQQTESHLVGASWRSDSFDERPRLTGGTRREKEIVDVQISSSEAYFAINQLFTEREAKRARLLSTTRHGDETWYLLGVTPPDASEARFLRSEMARIESALSKVDAQQLDEMLDDLVHNYDPFGALGPRAMLIRVPDDPNARIRGGTFDSDGFEADIAKFDPSAPADYMFRNSVEYFRDDGQIPERFSALLKLDPDENQ